MMRGLTLILLLHCLVAYPQKLMHGKVVDAQSGEPIARATIFIANSTQQTLSDDSGMFSIAMTDHAAQLVVTHVGYNPMVLPQASFPDRTVRYVVPMETEVNQLRPVSILSKKMREKLLKSFYNNFLGTSQNASDTTIRNPDEILFHLNDDGSWEASATEPLEITNPNLNYSITFLLVAFKVTPHETSFYAGYPTFSDLKPVTKKHRAARQKAYLGSQLHFVRAAYHDQVAQDGFTLNYIKRELNPSYPSPHRYKELIEDIRRNGKGGKIHSLPPKYISTVLMKNAPISHFMTEENSKKYFLFDHYLEVIYTRAYEEGEYYNGRHGAGGFQVTEVRTESSPIRAFPNGNIDPVDNMVFQGYMGWKKVADMLPLDYEPDLDK